MAEVENLNENNSAARRAAQKRAYALRPDVVARHRAASIRVAREKTFETTISRFEKHSVDELLDIVIKKCEKQNIDFESKRAVFIELLQILHTP